MKITGTSIAAMLLLCSLAQAQDNRGLDSRAPENHGLPAEGIHYGWADVLRVDPVYDEQGQPAASHEECYDEQVPVQGPDNRAGATVLGAVIGGVVGSTIGKGNGRTAATIGGAVVGGAAGHAIGSRTGEGDAWQVVVQLDDGRYATVTQREPPNVQIGDYVVVENDHVYLRGR